MGTLPNMRQTTQQETPLRAALREQGRMQVWLAREVDCHPSEISDYVRGVHVPAEGTRARISVALRQNIDELWPDDAERQTA